MDCIFIDYDGTLCVNHEVSPRNAAAIKAVRALGHKVFLNTGRSAGNIPADAKNIPFDGYCCGFSYWDLDGKVLHETRLSPEDATACLRDAQKFGIDANAQGLRDCFYYIPVRPENPSSFWLDDAGLERLLSSPEDIGQIQKITFDRNPLPEGFRHPGLDLICYGNISEGAPIGYDKTTSMRELGKLLGVPPENMLAIGDSPNDLPMLLYAGKRAIMHSAPASLDETGAYRSPYDDCGVADALCHFYGVEI